MDQVTAVARRAGIHVLRVVRSGEVVLALGDQGRPVAVHSIRKSLIGALFGQAFERGLVSSTTTLAELDIDDVPPLTAQERTATVRDLLMARSGVHLPLAVPRPPSEVLPAELASLLAPWPPRGAYAPGAHWLYSNWDFNVLGNIYERVARTSVFLALDREIARPLGMSDWDPYRDGRYDHRADFFGATTRYPYYQLALSARDLALFGALYLQHGRWNGTQLIPADWVATSTHPSSETSAEQDHSHYGHLWWVSDGTAALPTGSYSALGIGGQFLTVVPELDLVLVGLSDTYADGFVPVEPSARSALYRSVIEAFGG